MFAQNRPDWCPVQRVSQSSCWLKVPFNPQMIFLNQKPQNYSRKVWSLSRSIQPQRKGKRGDAGECFVSETKITEWIWRPLNLTKELSAMEVGAITLQFNNVQICSLYLTAFSSVYFESRHAASTFGLFCSTIKKFSSILKAFPNARFFSPQVTMEMVWTP